MHNNAGLRAQFPAIDADEWPGALADLYAHLTEYAPACPADFRAVATFAAWAAVLPPETRVDATPPDVWGLVIADCKAAGAVACDEAAAVARAATALLGREVAWFTGGGADGLARRLALGRVTFALHADYAPILRHAKQFPHAKQFLSDVADGRLVAHELGQVFAESHEPYTVALAACTPEAFAEYAQPADLAAGFLARFLPVVAAPGIPEAPPPPDALAREAVAVTLAKAARHVAKRQAVSGPHLPVAAVARTVFRDLPVALSLLPGGDSAALLVARAVRLAALLALARADAAVTPEDAWCGVRLVARCEEDRRVLMAVLSEDRDALVYRRVVERLTAAHAPITARALQQQTHQPARLVLNALDRLIGEGRVVAEEVGQTTGYALARRRAPGPPGGGGPDGAPTDAAPALTGL